MLTFLPSSSSSSSFLTLLLTTLRHVRCQGPGHFNDPDMLQVGNGPLTMAEQRSHFGLWAITKSTLILGSKVSALSSEQLSLISNKDLIVRVGSRNATPLSNPVSLLHLRKT